ncbi:DNA cytosine methyltransferase [Belnapia moabensis]|uniref:DNA cytosine methyltransferase n=1 Tax=Belnapia moabensis TaxID=365533 RepID=UPI000A0456B9|nr:DNA cytosine methyltransferase [Belnapia moabensis]
MNFVPPGLPTGRERRLSLPIDLFVRQRLLDVEAPRFTVLDLFAGAGGFSLGFQAAGAKLVGAVEIDDWAVETLEANHPHCSKVVKADLRAVSDNDLKEWFGKPSVIIGGPPCQGFSHANNAARGSNKDPRNSLFREFIRVADVLQPDAILMENVPGLLKRTADDHQSVISIIEAEFKRIGFHAYVQVLKAQDYGIPQIRPRLFVLGLRAGTTKPFPMPTHFPDASPGLFGTELLPLLSLWDAISDLPHVEPRGGAEDLEQAGEAQNDYQRMLRAGSTRVFNHTSMRHSQRLIERFSKLKWGESSADAPEEHAAFRRGAPGTLSEKQYDQNNRRLFPDRPCHTLPASFYANFVHPFLHRNFTPREGARIQSFPDWYRFSGKPTVVSTRLLSREGRSEELHLCQYNQIGNAVPPLLAYHLATHLREMLGT